MLSQKRLQQSSGVHVCVKGHRRSVQKDHQYALWKRQDLCVMRTTLKVFFDRLSTSHVDGESINCCPAQAAS